MKTLITLLALTTSVFADEATVSWSTLVMVNKCPGNEHHSPLAPETATFSSRWKTNTWRTATTNDPGPYVPGDTIWMPKPLAVESYTEIGDGEMTTSPQEEGKTDQGFFIVHLLKYPGTCCVHTGYICMTIVDIATFSGGGAGVPTGTTNTVYNFHMSEARYQKDFPLFDIAHGIDNFNYRYARINLVSPGAEYGCGGFSFRRLKMTNGLPQRIEIRSGATNVIHGVYTNSLLSTNWSLATTFLHDENGDADIDVYGWNMPTNQGFYLIGPTNAP